MPAVNATFITFGFIGVVLPFIKGRTRDFPDYWTKPGFWLGLALGGFTAWAGGANEVKAALAYGYGVPEGLSMDISSEPQGDKEAGRGAQEFSLRACAPGGRACAPGGARVTVADPAPMTGGRG
jgi:hypothetical protein